MYVDCLVEYTPNFICNYTHCIIWHMCIEAYRLLLLLTWQLQFVCIPLFILSLQLLCSASAVCCGWGSTCMECGGYRPLRRQTSWKLPGKHEDVAVFSACNGGGVWAGRGVGESDGQLLGLHSLELCPFSRGTNVLWYVHMCTASSGTCVMYTYIFTCRICSRALLCCMVC